MGDSVVEQLQRLGMSAYEAKVYVGLVASGEPLSGYEVAKRSAVPRSTVYETLGKLIGRGAAFEVRTGSDAVGYLALPPAALMERLRRDFDESMDALGSSLPQVTAPPQVRLVHNLTGRDPLLARAEDVVGAARTDLFLSGWPDEIAALKAAARRADARGVEVTVVTFGEDTEPVGHTHAHRFSAPDVVRENLGCRLLVVAGDRQQVVIGGVVDGVDARSACAPLGEAWGLYSDDPAVVLVAVEYVRHDVAMHVIAEKLAPHDFERFWTSDPTLRRLRADHGVPAALLARGRPAPRGGR